MLWDSWWNVWRCRSLPKRRRVASGSSLKRAADVAGAWTKQPIESLEDRRLLSAGDLDPGFSENGMVTTHVGAANSSTNGVVIDGDGKIVVAGTAIDGTNDGSTGDPRRSVWELRKTVEVEATAWPGAA